jgi:methylglutaconyl-CoA hydratase
MSAEELVHLEVAGGVATVTLDSPHNRNALSRRLLADLSDRLEAALAEPSARLVVLTGTGPVFCSGADLKEQREANAAGEPPGGGIGVAGVAAIALRIRNAEKPVVCRVNGHARAGGLGLLAACDIAVAVESATFAFSEVRIGVAPAIISVVTLPKLGPAKGMELMLTGEPFTAGEAVHFGLINAAVPAESLDAAVGDYVARLLKGAPRALAATKRLVHEVPGLDVGEAFERMSRLSAELFASAEALEGMTAYAEKREPGWAHGR